MGCVSTPLCVIFQIWTSSVFHDLGGRIDEVLEDKGLIAGIGERQFEPQLGAHPSVVIKDLAHFVLDGLGLHGEVAHDGTIGLLKADGVVRDSRYTPVRPGCGEGGVVGSVVGGLSHNDRTLPLLEDARCCRRSRQTLPAGWRQIVTSAVRAAGSRLP